uniref:BTB domain-containing protein n=1 Tax=Dendroctonus ponderosae TaxID=77166 RepID=A0AAR5QHL5_DENPD
MSKNCKKSPRYIINWETHASNLLKNFCSLMEHQSLVDIVLCCGNNTIQAHKFVLAANSPFFREEFEKNPSIEQIMIGGCDFAVLKSVVEIMYCGQTLVNEDNVKYLVAIIKLFQMKHLENLFTEHASSSEASTGELGLLAIDALFPITDEDIYLPKPQFLTKKPKYPTFSCQLPHPPAVQNNSIDVKVTPSPTPNISLPPKLLKPTDFNVNAPDAVGTFKPYPREKRTLKQQAEQACFKEAQASRMALASLQKQIAAAPQVSSFIIEDSCAETTVENFIPHPEPVPFVQIFDYDDDISEKMKNGMFLPVPVAQPANSSAPFNTNNQRNQTEKRSLTADKLKYILGSHLPTNVEVMYKDAEGNFVPVNEEVLQNLANKEGKCL